MSQIIQKVGNIFDGNICRHCEHVCSITAKKMQSPEGSEANQISPIKLNLISEYYIKCLDTISRVPIFYN